VSEFLTITYRHECGEKCERNGYEFTIKPDSRDGVADIPNLECIQTGIRLVEVGREPRNE